MRIKKVTPILVVDEIEPVLEFWEKQLGLERLASVQHGERLGFALLARDDVQLMLQSKESLAADLPAVAAREPSSLLYVDVASLEEATRSLAGVEMLAGPRTTFYGAREVFVVDASGQVTGFAEHAEEVAAHG